jgi:S1-C subfamily serine protease
MSLPLVMFLGLFALVVTLDPVPARSPRASVPPGMDPIASDLGSPAGAVIRFAQETERRTAPLLPGPAAGAGRAWLGARIQTVTRDIADGLGLKIATGALVASVLPESPASRAGIRRGDVILRLDGVEIGDAPTFAQKVGRKAPGDAIDLVLVRRGARRSLTVALGSHPRVAEPAGSDLPERSDDIDLDPLLGISVEPLSDEARSGHGIAEDVDGVVVTRVRPTQKLLRVREVVFEVDQVAVRTPLQLMRRANAVRRAGRSSVLLTVASPRGETRYVAVPFSTAASPPDHGRDGGPFLGLQPLQRLEKLE